MQSLDIVQTVRQVDTPYLSTFPGNFPVPNLWWYITGYTLVVCAGVFFIAGCFAARTVRSGKRWLWLILPFSFCVIGGLIGFLVGLIPGGLIAAIYVSIPYSIGKDVAFWLGFAQSIMITYFQFGRGEYVIGVSQMMP